MYTCAQGIDGVVGNMLSIADVRHLHGEITESIFYCSCVLSQLMKNRYLLCWPRAAISTVRPAHSDVVDCPNSCFPTHTFFHTQSLKFRLNRLFRADMSGM
jgi:hypothetical protein